LPRRGTIEFSETGIGVAPEFSLDTHFSQDLMKEQIYPVAVQLDDVDMIFNLHFFYKTPNTL
jgi:hypothetical protein